MIYNVFIRHSSVGPYWKASREIAYGLSLSIAMRFPVSITHLSSQLTVINLGRAGLERHFLLFLHIRNTCRPIVISKNFSIRFLLSTSTTGLYLETRASFGNAFRFTHSSKRFLIFRLVWINHDIPRTSGLAY